MDLAKLKVADLKAELAARNLDTKGVKAVLLERLKEAIERETNAVANVDLGVQQQYLAQQQQHQQHLLLQQQQLQAQHLQAQQQLFIQQQQLQLQHELQQQQQPQSQPQYQQNVMDAEELPQEQTIEDLSMPSKRVDTPVRRRSTRRSMTRSPSPTNSSGENPHASLMGSARKRGRSRSMTKSPSPQRLASEAPILASVQEEDPDTMDPETERRLLDVEDSPERPEADFEDSSSTAAADTEAPAQMPSDSNPNEESTEPEEPTKTSSAMEVEESRDISTPADNVAKSEDAAADTKPSLAEEAEVLPANDDTTSVVPEAEVKKEQQEEEEKDKAEEPTKADETKDKDVKATVPAAGTGSNDKSKAGATKGDKKQNQQQQAQNNVIEFVSEEIEPQVSDEAANSFLLSWYDSDLNLAIDDKDLLSAKPLSDGIFGLVWAGVRANRGIDGGKAVFEVLVTKELQPATRSPLIPEGESVTPEIRIGWSLLEEGKRQLGEADHSYGYSNCGQKVVGGNFETYGLEFGKNDVVGAYVDLDSSPCQIEFTVNRVRQGVAFEFDKEALAGKALFPHVYTKNLSFKVNFGAEESGFPLQPVVKKECPSSIDKPAEESKADESKADESKADESKTDEAEDGAKVKKEEDSDMAEETKATETEEEPVKTEGTDETEPEADTLTTESVPFNEDFKFLNRFIEEDGAHVAEGLKGPSARDCCELVMMIGLPGCGKTTWVQNYLKETPDKMYTLLSIDCLLENMKLSGKPRDPSNSPQWQKIVEQLSRNMARLIEVACKRRRNFILDQTNVFSSEQKRRLKGFGGFKIRRAVAVVPNVEEYKRRYELKVAKFGKEVPETTLNTMKANIFVPSLVQNWYTEIVFAELPEAEAQETIKKMNEEGRKLLPPRRNRANQSNRQKHNNANANSNYTSRWNHNRAQGGGQQYGKNRYGGGSGGSGGYNRYGNKSNEGSGQYGHHRSGDYRSGNGYGRRDEHHRGGNYGGGGNRYEPWTRNSGGYYNDRGYSNRGYHQQQQQQDHSNNRYDARRRDRRGYNNGSGWNNQGGQNQQWNSYPKSGSSESWYLWWQSNLNNLLAPNGGNSDASASSSSQWNQYGGAQQSSSSYGGNYNAKGSGAGSSNMGS